MSEEGVDRFRVEEVETPERPGITEHRVVDVATGAVLLRFEEWPNFSKPWDPDYEGTSRVEVEQTTGVAVVSYHDGRVEAVPIPEVDKKSGKRLGTDE